MLASVALGVIGAAGFGFLVNRLAPEFTSVLFGRYQSISNPEGMNILIGICNGAFIGLIGGVGICLSDAIFNFRKLRAPGTSESQPLTLQGE